MWSGCAGSSDVATMEETMHKTFGGFLAASFALGVVGGVYLHSHLVSTAMAQPKGRECVVPKNYGTFKFGFLPAFEASDGTIRIVDPDNCSVQVTMRRQ